MRVSPEKHFTFRPPVKTAASSSFFAGITFGLHKSNKHSELNSSVRINKDYHWPPHKYS